MIEWSTYHARYVFISNIVVVGDGQKKRKQNHAVSREEQLLITCQNTIANILNKKKKKIKKTQYRCSRHICNEQHHDCRNVNILL